MRFQAAAAAAGSNPQPPRRSCTQLLPAQMLLLPLLVSKASQMELLWALQAQTRRRQTAEGLAWLGAGSPPPAGQTD